MSRITLNSNIASLNTQRRLTESSKALESSFERLSSGLRINRAKDDAAGLAIASALSVDRRIFNQGVRNLSDGASLLNIAEGSLEELSNIVIRLRELAEQSANGTLAVTQRKALDAEAQQLSREFTRIAQSTQFNGRVLFDGQVSALRLQAGYGADGAIVSSIGGEIGDGSFANAQSIVLTSQSFIAVGDVSGDGIADLATAGTGGARVHIGNGDGTFKLGVTQAGPSVPGAVQLTDFNGDGKLDLLNVDQGAARVFVFLGCGDGSFRSPISFVTATATGRVAVEDFNGDGKMDIGSAQFGGASVSVLIGNGDGTFRAVTSYVGGTTLTSIQTGDINKDGVMDLAVGDQGSTTVNVLYGNGDGTFKARVCVDLSAAPSELTLADLNNDGGLDIVISTTAVPSFRVALGNGDGTFRAPQFIGAEFFTAHHTVGDFNGDGFSDVAIGDIVSTGSRIHLGNGNGTFRLGSTYASTISTVAMANGDFDGDGVLDAVNATGGGFVEVRIGNSLPGVAPLLPFSLRYAHQALQALSTLEDAQTRINLQRATIGAFQSRIASGVGALQQTVENVATAESRIVDVDVADEAAKLTRSRILQQAGAAILAQANRGSSLALRLLEIDGG